MRLLKSQIEKRDGSGWARLLPEEPEDMWHAYNLIQPSDHLTARALRRTSKTSDSGSVSSSRISLDLRIVVLSTDFDIQAGELHVAGRIASLPTSSHAANTDVKIGAHHTLDLELHRHFTLEKADGWDIVALELLKQACQEERKVELWAVVMGEGVANVCLITQHRTILRQRIEVPVPRKRREGVDGHDKGIQKFFATLFANLLRNLDLGNSDIKDKTVPLLLASPGFVASSFLEYVKAEAVRTGNKPLIQMLPSILVAHSSSHHVHALKEVLSSSSILNLLSDTKFARETQLMDKFFTMLRLDDGRAWYGPKEVEKAVEKGAVGRGGGVLLISNALFRAQNVTQRKRWVGLVEQVRDVEGGEVRILSSLHESGKRLESLGNVAAILTFPLEDLDEEDEAGEDGEPNGEDMVI